MHHCANETQQWRGLARGVLTGGPDSPNVHHSVQRARIMPRMVDMRVTLDLRSAPRPGRVEPRRLAVGHFPTVLPPTFTCTGKDRVIQSWPLSAPGDWLIEAPQKLGPYERMTLVRLCVALEKLGGRLAEHDLGPDFEEDLEAIRKQPWPGAISEIGLVL